MKEIPQGMIDACAEKWSTKQMTIETRIRAVLTDAAAPEVYEALKAISDTRICLILCSTPVWPYARRRDAHDQRAESKTALPGCCVVIGQNLEP